MVIKHITLASAYQLAITRPVYKCATSILHARDDTIKIPHTYHHVAED